MVRRLVARWALIGCLVATVGACKKEQRAPRYVFPVEVSVLLADGTGVADIAVRLNGDEVGRTDMRGQFSATVEGEPGQEVKLDIEPPMNHELHPDEVRHEWVKTLSAEDRGKEVVLEPVVFTVLLKATLLDYTLLVSATGGGRRVILDGKEVGSTSSRGEASIMFTDKPGRLVEVKLARPEGKAGRKIEAMKASFTLGESERILRFFEGETPVEKAGGRQEQPVATAGGTASGKTPERRPRGQTGKPATMPEPRPQETTEPEGTGSQEAVALVDPSGGKESGAGAGETGAGAGETGTRPPDPAAGACVPEQLQGPAIPDGVLRACELVPPSSPTTAISTWLSPGTGRRRRT